MYSLCAYHYIYMKFSKSIKNIILSNLFKEISHYCIWEGFKNKKIFQYTNQHSVPKIFNLNITTPPTFTKFYMSTEC